MYPPSRTMTPVTPLWCCNLLRISSRSEFSWHNVILISQMDGVGPHCIHLKLSLTAIIWGWEEGFPGLPWTTKACKNFTWMRSLRQKVAGVSMCDESSRDQSLVVDHRSPAQYGGKMSSSSDGSPDLYCSVHWSNKHGLNMSSAKSRSLYSIYYLLFIRRERCSTAVF